ncbi:hypothetical protein [Lacimicrobium alkaliphilum]|uniref:Methyltransferase type 11 domain-containing protein n=1 Tax=Lacimicrobium alkaliphilum TaxID=1526571 RepID=A0ABQ1RAF7_9ALTE|nr:hypothetical protein [Lacimicrobium alkaliphilum]GGD63976.1 hypothetical protein GCM10011357_19200 [Lacimicrobium alkaliphilum]
MFNTYQEIFNNRAWSYHQAMQSAPDARRLEFEIALDYLQPGTGQSIVDMPSGGGYLKQYIQDPTTDLIFIETTSEFAKHCPESDDCTRLIGDFDNLPVQDSCADRLSVTADQSGERGQSCKAIFRVTHVVHCKTTWPPDVL